MLAVERERMMIVEIQKKSKNSKKHTACMNTKYSANQEHKIPSELELAPHFALFTLLILFKLFYAD